MKWPNYKGYSESFRTAKGVSGYLNKLNVAEYDTRYIESLKNSGQEEDFDGWIYDNNDNNRLGASIQIEFIPEYNPLNRPAWQLDEETIYKANMGETVIEPAHFEVRVTKYTEKGLAELETE